MWVRRKSKDLTGLKFNSWTVLSKVEKTGGKTEWNCVCECGTHRIVLGNNLIRGVSKSCNCKRGAHKMYSSKEYRAYHSMKDRCYNPNNKQYHDYGARGIKVCDRWLKSFEDFISDMGKSPSGLSLDRIDNNKGYHPDNCRWTTRIVQSNNTRKNVRITYNGKTLTLSQWSREINIKPTIIRHRISKGWPIEKVLQIQ